MCIETDLKKNLKEWKVKFDNKSERGANDFYEAWKNSNNIVNAIWN